MRRTLYATVLVILVVSAVVAACGGPVSSPAATSPASAPEPTNTQGTTMRSAPATATSPAPAPEPTITPEATTPGAPAAATTTTNEAAVQPSERFDPANFDRSASITNTWLPLKPGTRYTYEGKSVDDNGDLLPHRIVVNVTDLTKMIGGVRALVTWDQDYSADNLAEAELAFYAQDKDGNVWYMGEYPEVYEGGKLVEAPTWIDGIADAKAGIMMKANPQVATPRYSEGWGPAVGWTDTGKVDQMGQKTCVAVNCYEDVLVIAETSQGEPGAEQLKYYARGVGNVRVGWRGGGEKTKETLELVKMEQLSAEALAEVRAKALELEKSAYENSKDVYAHTPPAEQDASAG